VFVDVVDVYCAMAVELGMTAVHFVSAEQAIPEIRAAVGQQQ
ncbi:MAG: hypothetical protein QOH13_859, partial [Thermoleophilaceae bacterium]|nr:hypothetical protein [Thermoleophilaceae bacterium]